MRRPTTATSVLAAAALAAGAVLLPGVASAAPPVPRDPKWSADHLIDAKAARVDSYVGNRPFEYTATNTSGDAVASYIRHGHGFESHAYVVVRDAGGRWSAPKPLGNVTSDTVQVGIDAGGRAFAVWSDNPTTLGIYWMHRSVHGTWSKPALVPGIPRHAGTDPTLAVSPSGVLAVGFDVSGRVYAKVRSGHTWQPAVALSAVPSQPGVGGGGLAGAAAMALTVSPDGSVAALWGWIAERDGSTTLQAGGIGRDGKAEAVYDVDAPATLDDLMDLRSAAGPDARTSAFWDDGHPGTVVYRIDGRAWHTYRLPVADTSEVTSEKVTATAHAVTAWWSVGDDTGSTVYRSTQHDGGWSPAQAVMNSSQPQGLVVQAAGQSASGTVFAVRRSLPGPDATALRYQTVVRTHLGDLDDVYRFPIDTVGPKQAPTTVQRVEVAGTKAVMLWSGVQVDNHIAPLYVRSTSSARRAS